jgi:dTDP-4-dehydrorhamnose reductase
MEARWNSLKLFITGGSGLFGSKLAQKAIAKGIEVYSAENRSQCLYGNSFKLDITDKEAVSRVIGKIKPDAIVHAASLTDVDKCELNKDLAWKINVDGTKNILQSIDETNPFLVYISTDYVFSGEKGCYVESDAADPVNYYGLTKLIAEELVQTRDEFLIARPSVIYGSSAATGKINFALFVLEKLRKGEKVKAVSDQWNTPTLNTNFADMTIEAIERRLTGVYHLCGATRISRFDFARKIAETFYLDETLIEKACSEQFCWPAKRPQDSSLDTSKAQRALTCKPLKIIEALEQLKQEITQK